MSGGVGPVEQPFEIFVVVGTEPTSELARAEVTRSPLYSTIQHAHAGQRDRVEHTEPQQRRDMLASSPIQQQLVPAHEVCSEVAHSPATTQRIVLPLFSSELTKKPTDVATLITHHGATRDAALL